MSEVENLHVAPANSAKNVHFMLQLVCVGRTSSLVGSTARGKRRNTGAATCAIVNARFPFWRRSNNNRHAVQHSAPGKRHGGQRPALQLPPANSLALPTNVLQLEPFPSHS